MFVSITNQGLESLKYDFFFFFFFFFFSLSLIKWPKPVDGYETHYFGPDKLAFFKETDDALILALTYHGSATEVVNNGHAIQVNVEGHNTLTLEGGAYELKQFHFHTPSENTILGKQFPLEVHFVHANTKGELAVVGIMYELESKPNQSLKALLSDTLNSKEKKQLDSGFDLAQLLPEEQDYYRFNGSLTTPPCSEGVRWVLMKEPLSASKDQIDTFAQSTGMNARPVQPINGRIVVK